MELSLSSFQLRSEEEEEDYKERIKRKEVVKKWSK
jgi:hypothetical protein